MLPSGCHPKDIAVYASKDGLAVWIFYTWPSFCFDASRVFEGQRHKYGTGVANLGSAKAAGLDLTTEAMKPSSGSVVQTTLSIALEQPVEPTLVDYEAQPSKLVRFYKIPNPDWPQYPTILCQLASWFNVLLMKASNKRKKRNK